MTRRRKALAAGKLPAQARATMVQNGKASEEILAPNSSPLEVAKFLERRVATRLQGKEAPSEHKAPPAMLALAQEIMEQVVNSKPTRLSESLPDTPQFNLVRDRFHAIFGKNNFVYTVPNSIYNSESPIDPNFHSLAGIYNSESPIDPNFHSLAGSQFIYMDLELAFPDFHILCCNCKSKDLTRKRDCYSQNKTLLRIVTDANETWCRPFKYKCNRCKHEFETNEGPFLANLPAFIRNQYPVDPRYAKKGNHCHLSKSASRIMSMHKSRFDLYFRSSLGISIQSSTTAFGVVRFCLPLIVETLGPYIFSEILTSSSVITLLQFLLAVIVTGAQAKKAEDAEPKKPPTKALDVLSDSESSGDDDDDDSPPTFEWTTIIKKSLVASTPKPVEDKKKSLLTAPKSPRTTMPGSTSLLRWTSPTTDQALCSS
ncbi:unnamed protein product [Cylindrotheca closterium]|uniref:Uncharacterized protein n=1 Tax=Cylindrotheca closterium TaxID=2856 RepID=A0AAD2CEA7_9STRA|nr:unnamed protein product [Cylindrotheca closterium]